MADKPCVTFVWKIENFYHCPQEEDKSVDSPEFYVDTLSQSAWELLVFPNRFNEEEVKVFLYNKNKNETSLLFIDYDISFLSANGSVLVTGEEKNVRIDADTSYQIAKYPTKVEIFESRSDEFLPHGILTVRCRIWKSRKTLTHPILYFARTRIGFERICFHWAVTEFSQLKLNGRKKTRRVVICDGKPIFSVALYLAGAAVTQASVAIDIKQVTKGIPRLFSTCTVSVLDETGSIVKKSGRDSFWFTPQDTVWNFAQFLTKNELTARRTKWCADDVLNLLFDLTFTTDVEYSNIESVTFLPSWIQNCNADVPGSSDVAQGFPQKDAKGNLLVQAVDESVAFLQEDFHSLYKEKAMSDFELRTGGVSFPVHKTVLAARSPVFKAMFSSDMKEGADDFLEIPDVDGGTLDRLLLFIYTGKVEDLQCDAATKLYYAADKYEVLSLKKKCSAILTVSVTDSNVCEILLLADRHIDEELKSSVHDYIVINDDEIIRSTEWKRFLGSNPALAAETMQLIYSKKLDMLAK